MDFLVVSKGYGSLQGTFSKEGLLNKLTEMGYDAANIIGEVMKKGKLEYGSHRIMSVR